MTIFTVLCRCYGTIYMSIFTLKLFKLDFIFQRNQKLTRVKLMIVLSNERSNFGWYFYYFNLVVYIIFLLALTTYTIISQDVSIQSKVQREAIIGLGLVTDRVSRNQTEISEDLRVTKSPLSTAVANLTANASNQISASLLQGIDSIYVNLI